MHWTEKNGLKLGGFASLGILAPELALIFCSRIGGFSEPPFDSLNLGEGLGDDPEAVRLNRGKLLDSIGFAPEAVARGRQVHGTRIETVDSGGLRDATDGLITTRRGLALAISTADCYPVFIYSPTEKVLAALHVGRAGAGAGIIGKAFDILYDTHHIDPYTAIAVAGPGICGDCYTVSGDHAAGFPAETVRTENGTHRLDLLRFCVLEFLKAGLRRENIKSAGLCTSCSADLCYSYRRDGGRTGRHWTIAAIGPSP